MTLNAPHTVITEVVYVLRSPRLYHLQKARIAEMLAALERDGSHAELDLTAALIIALAPESEPSIVYSYDTDYDRFEGITRREPDR